MPFKTEFLHQREDTIANGATLDTDFSISDDVSLDERFLVIIRIPGTSASNKKNSVAFAIGGGAKVGVNIMEMMDIGTYSFLTSVPPTSANVLRVHFDNGSGGSLIYNTSLLRVRKV